MLKGKASVAVMHLPTRSIYQAVSNQVMVQAVLRVGPGEKSVTRHAQFAGLAPSLDSNATINPQDGGPILSTDGNRGIDSKTESGNRRLWKKRELYRVSLRE